jgi:hypothetical protein
MLPNDMERLLQRRNDNGNNILPIDYVPAGPDIEPQKALKSASLQDFVEMVAMLVSKTMKKRQVVFKPDEGARMVVDPSKPLENPFVFFEVISRIPKKERKPREREEIVESSPDKKSNRQGRIWGQKFACIVQFNFLACDYSTVNAVMNDFENLIFSYTPYFKKNGVAELLFEKHFTDKNLDLYRQSLSVRSLQYYVEIEKLTAVFESEIEDITVT